MRDRIGRWMWKYFALALALGATVPLTRPAPPPAEAEDADATIIQTVKAQFPLELQRQGIGTGEVRLMLEVDGQGRLMDCLVTGFTRKEFADEALKAVRTWRFIPARLNGRPASAVLPLTVLFRTNGVLAVTRQAEQLPRPDTHYEYEPCPTRELDQTPKVLTTVPPLYPKELSDRGVRGRVTLDFYIDETGRVRFPVAREPADPQLAGLAIAALKVWFFEPPRRQGVPVLARASTSFAFDPPE